MIFNKRKLPESLPADEEQITKSIFDETGEIVRKSNGETSDWVALIQPKDKHSGT
jgi:hypothetical protein